MRIGIDLDNTIIDYNLAFKKYIFAKKILIPEKNLNKNNYLTKSILKTKILKLKKGNIFWQKIQGQIYGKYINMADIYSGFKRFVFLSNLRNFEIFIVSHKTKYGHFDKSKTLLRNSAIKFLKKK